MAHNGEYISRHKRVNASRGAASGYLCAGGCGDAAREWAEIQGSDADDPANYMPMCCSCHRRYDLGQERCPQGHLYDEENTYWRPGRKQSVDCRACQREASKKHYASRVQAGFVRRKDKWIRVSESVETRS